MPDDKSKTTAGKPSPDSGAIPDKEPNYIADKPVGEIDTGQPTVQSPVTETGLPVEDQIDKEWDPNKDGGLPTFLNAGPNAGRR